MFEYEYVPPHLLRNNVELAMGRAEFQIMSWTDKNKDGHLMFTQSGDKRIDLILNVRDSQGQEGKYFDILTPKMNWKLKTILDAVGLSELYSITGKIDLDKLIGKMGICELRPATNGYKKPNLIYITPEQAAKPYVPPVQHVECKEPMEAKQAINQQALEEYDNSLPF